MLRSFKGAPCSMFIMIVPTSWKHSLRYTDMLATFHRRQKSISLSAAQTHCCCYPIGMWDKAMDVKSEIVGQIWVCVNFVVFQ
jgi:uncharacterized membrane protein YpjA